MERSLVLETVKKVGQKVKITGWVNTRRDHGKLVFIDLRDRTGLVQIVGGKNLADLRPEDVVEIEGLVKNRPPNLINPKLATGKIEIEAEKVKILSSAEDLPILVVGEKSSLATRLDWRWIDLRRPENLLIFQVWTILEQAFRNYCIDNEYIEIHSPKTTITSTESGSELFEIKYFNQKAYLVQSPQLYKQMAMAAGFEKVFEVGPVFRANPSFTSRHDTEFTMYDVEISFIESHYDLMAEEERMMVAILSAIKEKYGKEIKKIYGQEVVIPKIPFPKLTLVEAKKILKEMKIPSERGEDLSPKEEEAISRYIQKKKNHEFVFIHDWPASARAFYSMRLEKDPSLSKTFDLLFKGIEVTSGAQREHRYEKLKKQIIDKGFKVKPFETYLNFFRYGCPPHGGFAPGPTRILMKIFGLSNVREVTYLYRGVNRLTP